MAEKNNQDLAVLGFSVKAESAMQALEQLDAKLRNIDANFKKADAALERKIVSTLAAIEKPMGKLDRTSAVVASFGEAFKQFAAAAKTDGLADVMTLLTKSLDAMAKSGLDKIAKTYARSLGEATMAFGQLGQNVTRTTNGIGSIMSSVFDKKNLDSVNIYLQRLEDARDLLKGYSGELKDKLPFGITLTNVKQAQTAIGGMITTVQKYASLLDPNNRREKTDVQNSANALLEQFKRNRQSVEDAINGLFPNGNTVKINVELANAETITNAIPKSIRVDIAENAQKTLAQYFTQLDAFKNGINALQVAADPESIKKLKDDVGAALLPTISFKYRAKDAVKDLYDALRSALEDKPFEVPVAFTFGNDVLSSKKAVEDPIEEFKNKVLMDMKADNWGAKVIKKNGAEWFSNIYNGAIREDFELANDFDELLQKIYQDEAEFEAQASKLEEMRELFKNGGGKKKEPASVLSSEAMSGIVSDFQKKIAPAAEEIQKLLNFEPKITIPDTISVDKITLSSKEVTVDTSSSVAKLMNEPLHVKGANVMVHPAAIKVDTAFVNPEAVKLIGGVQETLEKTVNVDPHVQAIKKVAEIYDKAAGAAGALEEKIKSVAKLLKGDMKALFTAVIKSGIADPNRELYRIAVQEEKLEEEGKRWQSVYDALTNGDASGVSQARVQDAEQSYKRRKQMEETVGQAAKNANQQQKEYNETLDEFNKNLDITDKNVDELVRSLGQESAAMKSAAQAERQAIQSTAQATAAMAGFDASVNRASWSIERMGRVIPSNLTDPFVKMKAEIGETGIRIADFGRSIGLYFGGRTVINYFRQAAESANTFGMEIRRIQSLATDFDFSNLKSELMDIDARFGSVVHNANALYWAFSSGVRGSERDLANFTEIMSKTATTIKSDIMPTVDAATSVMNAWNLTAGSAGEIGDLLFSIIKYGKSNASQLTTALGHVVAPAAALNLNLDELGASIATLTKTMKTNRALTYLSNILGKLASPTKKVQEAAAEFGIELSANAIKARGFAQTLRDIRAATGGDVGKIAKLFPDLRGQRAAITLLSTQYKDFEQQLVNMENKAGAMEEALSRITDTPESQLRALKNTISMVSIGAGDAVNNVLTLGGALGPILKTVNGLEHGGRELLGHLVAAAGATAGIAIAMRAMKVAQFAAAQAAFQLAAAETDTNKVALSNALLAEKRLVDENALMVATLKREVAEKHNNDEILQNLRAQLDTYKEATKEGNKRIVQAQQALKIEDQIIKRRMQEKASGIGTSKARLASLGGWLTELQTGEGQKNLNTSLNLIKRLQADISESGAKLADEQRQLIQQYNALIQPLVEKEGQTRAAMMDAMHSGQVGAVENFKKLKDTILQAIKANTAIAGQKASYDQDERILEQQIRRAVLAEMQKGLVEGENYQHSLLIKFVEDEIKKEKAKLADMTAQLDVLKQQNATDAEVAAQVDAIAKQTAEVNALDAKKLEITTQIEQRERALTGRKSEQVKMLEASVNESQRILAIDTEDVEKLNEKLELQLKNAAVAGKATLEATKASVVAQRDYYASLLQLKTLRREEKTLIDDSGKLINESAEAEARLAEIQREREKTLKRMLALQEKFVALGVKAGNQEAIVLRQSNWGGSRGELVDRLARDKGVINDAVRTMSAEIGKNLFGGMLGGKGAMGLSMLTPFVPGMGRWGMAASMLASFNVFGKAASGMSRLTASTLRLMGTTEKLQKQGILQLDKGVEDLTRSLLTSRLTLKGFKASMDAIAESGKGGALAASMGWKAGLVVGIGALVGTLIYKGLRAYYSGHQGPFDELAEKMYGVGDSKGYGEMLQMRIDRMKQERQTNEEMQRELRRMLQIQKERFTDLEEQKTLLSNMNSIQEAIRKLEKIDGLEKLRDDITATVVNLNNMQRDLNNWTNWWQEMLFARRHYVQNYDEIVAELQKSIPEEKAKLDQLEGSLSDRFKTLFLGGAEYRYQSLYELLESDRSSALTPALDAQGKMGMAEKMVKMSVGRIASLLKLDDLAGQSTDQIREMIRTRESKLSIAYDAAQTKLINAQIGLKDPKLIKDEKKFKEAEENVRKLEESANAAKKELDDFESNIRSSMSDFYTKVIARAEALVNQTLETVKKNNKEVKYLNTRWNADWSFMNISHNIEIIKTAIEKITEDYRNGVGIFRELNQPEREQVFKSQVEKLTDSLHEQVISRVTALKGAMDSIAGLMTSISNDAFSGSKSLFDFRMNAPEYAWMRPQLIRQRMKMLNQLLQGENGAYAQRLKAFDTMNLRMDIQDYAGAAKALSDAQAYGKTALGYEREKYELIKRQADIERNINSSMYQLANTLQGQFAATSQTAVDVFSVESVRLQMRRIGENIAPAIDTSVQTKEQQFYEQLMEKDRQFGRDLMMAGERLNQRLQDEANNARMQAGAAKTMSDAATKIDGAAHTFEKTMNSQKTMIRVKRI